MDLEINNGRKYKIRIDAKLKKWKKRRKKISSKKKLTVKLLQNNYN